MLLDKMKAQSFPSRVVVLSSTAHNMGNVDVSDLHYAKGRTYGSWNAYGQSKQANLLFAKSVGDKTKGTSVTAVSIHPGGELLKLRVFVFVMLSVICCAMNDLFVCDCACSDSDQFMARDCLVQWRVGLAVRAVLHGQDYSAGCQHHSMGLRSH